VKVEEAVRDRDLPEKLFRLTDLAGREVPEGSVFVPSTADATVESPGSAPPTVLPAEKLSGPLSPHSPYSTNPPTSGAVLPWAADWGTHSLPVPLPLQTHNLLDGGVVIQYRCPEACPDLVAKLQSVAETQDRVLVAPYPWASSRLTLTAWGQMEQLESFDLERVHGFIEAHSGKHQHTD
jgi:hypothetical protein